MNNQTESTNTTYRALGILTLRECARGSAGGRGLRPSDFGVIDPPVQREAGRLDEEIVGWCRSVCKRGCPKLGIVALSRRYGVHRATMYAALTGDTWPHITDPAPLEKMTPAQKVAA